MATTATQPTSYLSDPNATAAYQTALAGAADLYSKYGAGNTPVYGAEQATQWANTVPGLLAAQTPYQVNAAQQMGNLQGYMNQFTNPALGYATSSAVPINTYQVGQSQINQYMSPYLNNVMNSAVQNINETNAQQQQQLLGNAISKGAFGGDRAGIAQAALARQQNLANNATLANILNTGYGQALGEANQQQGVAYGAQIANNQMLNAAANLMSNLGTQGQSAQIQQLQAQYNMGAAQHAQDQNAKNIAYQQYQNYMQQPYQQAKYLADMASGAATALGGTTVASIPQPSTVSQIAGGLGALAGQDFSGISNLFKNRGGSVRGSYATGGRMGYADGGTPSAGERLSNAYNAYTQAARAGADMPTLRSLYNDYINVKNETGPGGANIGQSDLGNQIRAYQYPTAASIEKANSSSAGGLASIAGLLAKLLAQPQKKGASGGGGGAQVPTRNVPTTTPQQAKPLPEASYKPVSQSNVGKSYIGSMGNTATPYSYLQSTLPQALQNQGISMANILESNPKFNVPLEAIAARPHELPAVAGGSTMAGQNLSMSPTNPYGFAMALGKDGQPVYSSNPSANANIPNLPGRTISAAEASDIGNLGRAGATYGGDQATRNAGPLINAPFGIGGVQGVSPIQGVVDKAQQDQAKAMDQRDVSAAELAAASPVQATGTGGQLSGLADLSNSQAIQAASQLGLNNLSPDQLMAAGFTADQAMAIGAANAMPPADQGVAPVTGGNAASQAEQNMMAPDMGQWFGGNQPSTGQTSSNEPVSYGSQEVWNNTYDMALANGLSDVQAVAAADNAAAQTNQLDTTQPTYINSSGQKVDPYGNPISTTDYSGYSATAIAPANINVDTVNQSSESFADLPSAKAQDVQNNASYYDPTGQTYTPATPTYDMMYDAPYSAPTYDMMYDAPYSAPSYDFSSSTPSSSDILNSGSSIVTPDYSYMYTPPSYTDYTSSSNYFDTTPYYSYDFSPSFDYGGFGYNEGGAVHAHREHRAVGGPNIQTGPATPAFGIAPISLNYGLPSSAQMQNAAEAVAGSGVVPVSQGMQALAARDFLGGGGMYRGGVVKHRG